MKMIIYEILKSLILLIFIPTYLFAGSDYCGICKISIQDINKGTKYYIDYKFKFVKGGVGQRKYFYIPGTDYRCTL